MVLWQLKVENYKCSLFCSYYKGKKFIEQYLDNVLEQSVFKDIEFIFLDCNSPENEYEYIKPLTNNYDNIKYHKLDKDLLEKMIEKNQIPWIKK